MCQKRLGGENLACGRALTPGEWGSFKNSEGNGREKPEAPRNPFDFWLYRFQLAIPGAAANEFHDLEPVPLRGAEGGSGESRCRGRREPRCARGRAAGADGAAHLRGRAGRGCPGPLTGTGRLLGLGTPGEMSPSPMGGVSPLFCPGPCKAGAPALSLLCLLAVVGFLAGCFTP